MSRAYPKLFFKPIFTCAASAKDLTIGTQLCVLTCLAKYLPDFWFRDADMVSVAIMSDPAGAKSPPTQNGTWGRARTGQSILLVELVNAIRAARLARDMRVVCCLLLLRHVYAHARVACYCHPIRHRA